MVWDTRAFHILHLLDQGRAPTNILLTTSNCLVSTACVQALVVYPSN